MASSITSVIGLPLIVLAAVKSKQPLGKGLLGRLKKLLPAVDYHDTIYMSRWVMFWSNLLTFNTVGYLAARSNNEKREHVVKSVILDVMWFLGDAVFAGLAGQHFQKKYHSQLGGVKLYKKGLLGVPIERSFSRIQADCAKLNIPKASKQRISKTLDKLARWQFRIGILSTSLLLGIGTTLANNYFTHQKLIEQQTTIANKYNYLFKQPNIQKSLQ